MKNAILTRRLSARKNRKKGFTLIEVIVVIVIIAILAAIAVPSLTRYIGSAEKRGAQATAHNIQVVLQSEKSEWYDYDFAPADKVVVGTPLFLGTLPTEDGVINDYLEVLSENGVIIKPTENLSGVKWDGNTLNTFTFTTSKWEVIYKKGEGFTVEDAE